MLDTLCSAIRNAPALELVGAAEDYRRAAEGIRETAIDTLLLDINLKGASGLDLIRVAKQKNAATQVLIISVLGDEHNVLQAIRNGADGYLIKDASGADVVAAILQAHAGHPPLSPAVARYVLRSLQAPGNAQAQRQLAPRELQMLKSLAAGYTYREIAERNDLSYHTVVDYVRSLYRKLDVNSRSDALMTGVRQGLISVDR